MVQVGESKKNVGNNVTRFVFDGRSIIADVTSLANTFQTYYLSGVGYVRGGVQTYAQENALGSTVLELNTTGGLVSRREYDAYGQESNILVGTNTPFRFAGKHGYQTDLESGFDLLDARFYLPGVGRFLTQDPVGQKGGLNLYGYCEDNPLTKIDPDGKQGLSLDSVRASISAAMRQATTDPRAAVQSLQELGKLSGITAATSNLIQRRIEQINLQISLQHTHHYLPQRYLAWFNARGINIENYTYRINAELHRIIHGKFVQQLRFYLSLIFY